MKKNIVLLPIMKKIVTTLLLQLFCLSAMYAQYTGRYYAYSRQLDRIDIASDTYFQDAKDILETVIIDDSLSVFEKEHLIGYEYTLAGHIYYEKENYDIAAYCFTQVIDHSTQIDSSFLDLDRIYFLRANSYRLLKKYQEAIDDYTYIHLNADYNMLIEFYNNRGDSYEHLGEYDKALQDFDKVSELEDRDNYEIVANRARIYVRLGKYEEATSEYEKFPGFFLEDASFYRNKAETYIKAGQSNKAIRSLEKVLEYDPDNEYGYRDEIMDKLSELKENNDRDFIANHPDSIDKGYISFNKSKSFEKHYLERFAILANPHIMPQFIDDGFYYTNIETGEILIPKRFNEAYPFLNNAALVKFNDEYVVIDTLGGYLVEPGYFPPVFYNLDYRYHCALEDCDYDFIKQEKLEKNTYSYTSTDYGRPNSQYSIFEENEKMGLKRDEDSSVMVEALYDSISYLNPYLDIFLLYNENKVGIVRFDLNEELLSELHYDSISFNDYASRRIFYNYTPIIGLYKSGWWHYFDVYYLRMLCKSQHKVIDFTLHNIGAINPRIIGIYNVEDKYNVLYYDGTSLPNDYDWIDISGTYAKKDDTIYLINGQKESIPYIQGVTDDVLKRRYMDYLPR